MKVVFCHSCGRVVLKSFLFCPYCGSSMRMGADVEHACAVFDRLEQRQIKADLLRIDRLLADLEAIACDLELLMLDDVSSIV